MKKETLLAILQQGEYDVPRLKKWMTHHDPTEVVTPPQWTGKLTLINALSTVLFFLPPIVGIELAVNLLNPAEQFVRWCIYTIASLKLTWFKLRGLKVVAIAGSYGKTSTKQLLHHTLSDQLPTLMTPKSINTLLGIADVILHQLHNHHKVFIVEFGEYHLEDIPNLTQFVKPHFGVLTPIGRQHLEQLGSFENIIKTMAEFVYFFADDPSRLLIHEQNRAHFPKLEASFYGASPKAQLRVFNVVVSRAGTEFEVLNQTNDNQTQTWQVFTPLYGEHQAINALACFWLGSKFGLTSGQVIKRLATMPYITRRHQPTFAEHNVLILDNSYNTNADSIKESLKLLNQLQPSRRLIVTLGFTETGDQAESIHRELGTLLADQVDYVGLIKAPWTDAIIEGFVAAGGKKTHIRVGNTQEEALAQIQTEIIPNAVVLFEGGYQEVYV